MEYNIKKGTCPSHFVKLSFTSNSQWVAKAPRTCTYVPSNRGSEVGQSIEGADDLLAQQLNESGDNLAREGHTKQEPSYSKN